MTIIEKTLKNVLKSGVVNDVKWYYGKLKNNDYYGFVFHIIVNNENIGSIIPIYKNIINDNDFNDFLNESIDIFERQYKFTMENK